MSLDSLRAIAPYLVCFTHDRRIHSFRTPVACLSRASRRGQSFLQDRCRSVWRRRSVFRHRHATDTCDSQGEQGNSPWHEARSCALLILVYRIQSKRTQETEREAIYQFYLRNTARINNWDLVDLTCRDIVGNYLLHRDRAPIYQLAQSESLWEQRISIVSTWAFIKAGDFTDTLNLAIHFSSHPHDLIHKAIGWMLREVGKMDREVLTQFLEQQATNLPRTALRYAIEHYPEAQRQYFLHKQ